MTTGTPWRRLVAEVEATATRAGRAALGCCSLEGTRLFERALRAGARLPRALTTAGFLAGDDARSQALLRDLKAHGCELVEAPAEELERLTQGRSIGALVGLAELPSPLSLAELLALEATPTLLGSVGQDDPGNAGALVRTAHAFGAVGFLAIGAVDPLHPKAVRTSMGSVFRLPVLSYPDLDAARAELHEAGATLLGAVTDGGAPLPDWRSPTGPLALLLGSEAFGLSAAERAACDGLVHIPMAPGVDSLSINAAAGALMYEAQRQRASRS